MMSNPIIRIHDISTDEVIDREMTDDEYTEHQTQKAFDNSAVKDEAQAAADKAALLARLGITADEAKLLLN